MSYMRRRCAIVLIVVLSLMTFITEFVWATTLLPYVRFKGSYQTTAGIGTGYLTLNATIYEMKYGTGEVWRSNLDGDTIWGANVVISGATRTGDYSFNGDPGDPDDVTFSIVGTDGYVYLTSTLADSEFTMQGSLYVWMNQWLNANDPATLNMHNVILRPYGDDGSHPSRYINELAAYLAATNVSGMQMKLLVPPTQDFKTNSTGSISMGLIDGLQSMNTPPLANAGENVNISSEAVATTIIQGTALDADTGDVLQCRWLEGQTPLTDWTVAGTDGACPLDLSAHQYVSGQYTLTLEVSDGELTSSDEMILTVENSAPNAGAGGGGTKELGSAVILTGDVSDFDGDTLSYEWKEGDNVLCSGSVDTIAGGTIVEIPDDCSVTGMGLGIHEIVLQVNDGINATVSSNTVTVEIIDTTKPTLAPVANSYLLWPPNHIMVDIVIAANASDNSGDPVALSATVSSNEPEDGLGD